MKTVHLKCIPIFLVKHLKYQVSPLLEKTMKIPFHCCTVFSKFSDMSAPTDSTPCMKFPGSNLKIKLNTRIEIFFLQFF